MEPSFHVITLSNDRSLYDAMRRSMAKVGFDKGSCRFTLLDNSTENVFEPFGVIMRIPSMGNEPYTILCHHDLVFGDRTTFATLRARVEELEVKYPLWAVAGCAGVTVRGEGLVNIDDPAGTHRAVGLPRSVLTLDELFLIFRRGRFPQPTPGMSGFHFYGTDVVVNARLQGNRAYVIDFPLLHLSRGDTASNAFKKGRDEMMSTLRKKALIGLVATTCTDMRVSCSAVIERWLRYTIVSVVLRRAFLGFIPKPNWWRCG